jgi:prolipoprotein diacylglyceryl transferase
MTTTVLAYFPSPPRGVWHLGPIPIRAYALFIVIGIVVALLIGDRRWEDRGGERGVIYDIALWAVPFGLVGGRLYHLATDWRTYFGEGGAGFGAALRIWDGGLGIWGAVALGGVGAWIGCRQRGIPLAAFADAIAPGIVLAQAIGRLGNYFNQEMFGRETTMPWGLEIFYRRDPAGFVDVHSLDGTSTGQLALVVQPTFLYELLWNVAVFAALIYLDRRFTIGHGRLFALYVAGYCLGRFWIELLRDDTATHIAGIRINSFTSTFVFIGAVVYLMLAPKGREEPATLGGAAAEEPVPEPATEVAAVTSPSGAAAEVDAAGGEAEDAATTAVETSAAADTAVEATEDAETVAQEPEAEAETTEVDTTATADTEAEETEAEAEAAVATDSEAAPEEPEATSEQPEAEEPEAVAVAPEPEEAAADVKEEEAKGEDAEADAEAEAEAPDAEKPEVQAEGEAEPADDEGEAAHDAVSEPTAEPFLSTSTGWRSRLRRLNPRSRRQ